VSEPIVEYSVVIDQPRPEVVEIETERPVLLISSVGARGPQGPQGRPGTTERRLYGEGPPGTIIGATPGQEYVDILTGDLYVLE
jgi:hypothetical protein